MPKTLLNPALNEHLEGSMEHRLNEQFRKEQMAIYKARLQKEETKKEVAELEKKAKK